MISAYAKKKISIDSNDIWEKREKRVVIGAFDITVKAIDYECRKVYIEKRDGYTSVCTDVRLAFDVTPNGGFEAPSSGVRVLDYTRCDSEALLRRLFPKKRSFTESERCG